MKNCLSCLGAGLIGLLVLFFIAGIVGTCSDSNQVSGNPYSTETATNTHFVSSQHTLAKTFFAGHIKKQMKDPDSYDEIGYSVTWNSYRKVYVVDLKFRGANSFGGKTVERWMGDVKFEGDYVSYSNVYKMQ